MFSLLGTGHKTKTIFRTGSSKVDHNGLDPEHVDNSGIGGKKVKNICITLLIHSL